MPPSIQCSSRSQILDAGAWPRVARVYDAPESLSNDEKLSNELYVSLRSELDDAYGNYLIGANELYCFVNSSMQITFVTFCATIHRLSNA